MTVRKKKLRRRRWRRFEEYPLWFQWLVAMLFTFIACVEDWGI